MISNILGVVRSFCFCRINLGGNAGRVLRFLRSGGVGVVVTASDSGARVGGTFRELNVLGCFASVIAYSRVKGNGADPSVCLIYTSGLKATPDRALMFRSTIFTTRATRGTNFGAIKICSRSDEGGGGEVGTIYSCCTSDFRGTTS